MQTQNVDIQKILSNLAVNICGLIKKLMSNNSSKNGEAYVFVI